MSVETANSVILYHPQVFAEICSSSFILNHLEIAAVAN